MSEGGFRSWANVAKFRKMLREVGREGVPPEIGPTVSVKEAMALLGKSANRVYELIREARLNGWKDPVSGRLHVRLEEVEWERARQRDKETRRQGDSETRTAAAESEDEGEEDCKPWSWDDVSAAKVVEDWAAASERRYQARLAELMAEIEEGNEETGKWGNEETGRSGNQETGKRINGGMGELGNEERGGREAISEFPNSPIPQSPVSCPPVEVPFPIGWVGWQVAAAMLDVNQARLSRIAREGHLERRRLDGRGPWLYDTVQVERLAADRLARLPRPGKHESIRWWGSRAQGWELGPFDYWMSAKDAAEMLGVLPGEFTFSAGAGCSPANNSIPESVAASCGCRTRA